MKLDAAYSMPKNSYTPEIRFLGWQSSLHCRPIPAGSAVQVGMGATCAFNALDSNEIEKIVSSETRTTPRRLALDRTLSHTPRNGAHARKMRVTRKVRLEKRMLPLRLPYFSGCCTTPASKSVERRLARVYVSVSWMSTIDSRAPPRATE